jgi:hypothetical protein
MPETTDANGLLRHLLATLAYRGRKTITGAPAGFATLQAGHGIRTPVEIFSHINHLLVRSAEIIRGGAPSSSQVASWDEECAGFLTALAELDRELASRVLSPAVEKKLLQGPLSDAMTHVGQLAMLRRWAGDPLPGERYTEAPIEAGRF